MKPTRMLPLITALLILISSVSYGQFCLPPEPIPSGITDKPTRMFDIAEYFTAHSGSKLETNPAKVKFAPFQQSIFGGGLGQAFATVTIHNPDPANQLVVDVDMFNNSGVLVPSATVSNVAIEPNGNQTVQLLPFEIATGENYGMVRVSVDATSNAGSFVGVVNHIFTNLLNPFEAGEVVPIENRAWFSTPLQAVNKSSKIFAGPFSIRSSSTRDAIDNNFCVVNLVNPNRVPVTVVADFISSTSGLIASSGPVTILPYGNARDFRAFNRQAMSYMVGLPDEDVYMTYRSSKPLIGDFNVIDYQGPGAGPIPPTPAPARGGQASGAGTHSDIDPTRLWYNDARIMSGMCEYNLKKRLTSTELTESPAFEFETNILVTNPSLAATGLTAVYRDGDGGILGIDSIGSVPGRGTVILGSGLPDSPNFPDSTEVHAGYVDILGCDRGLFGYTIRSNESSASWKKMYGETLYGNCNNEHTRGFRVTPSGAFMQVDPVAIDIMPEQDSSYLTVVNDRNSNLEGYFFTSFDPFGFITTVPNVYGGLQFSESTGSIVDDIINSPSFQIHGAYFNFRTGSPKGNFAFGDDVFNLFYEQPGGSYPGPGDTVGSF